MKILSRARHSRGFGIHSPFAFRFITHTLRRRADAMYYAEALMPRDRIFRLIIRVAAHLQPKSALLVDCDSLPSVQRALAQAYSRMTFNLDRPDIVVARVTAQTDVEQALGKLQSASVAAIILFDRGDVRSAAIADDISSELPAMTFKNGRDTIIKIFRSDLPHQTFEVIF